MTCFGGKGRTGLRLKKELEAVVQDQGPLFTLCIRYCWHHPHHHRCPSSLFYCTPFYVIGIARLIFWFR